MQSAVHVVSPQKCFQHKLKLTSKEFFYCLNEISTIIINLELCNCVFFYLHEFKFVLYPCQTFVDVECYVSVFILFFSHFISLIISLTNK